MANFGFNFRDKGYEPREDYRRDEKFEDERSGRSNQRTYENSNDYIDREVIIETARSPGIDYRRDRGFEDDRLLLEEYPSSEENANYTYQRNYHKFDGQDERPRHSRNTDDMNIIQNSYEEVDRMINSSRDEDYQDFDNLGFEPDYDYEDANRNKFERVLTRYSDDDQESVQSQYGRSLRKRKQTERSKTLIRKRSKFGEKNNNEFEFNRNPSRKGTIKKGTLPSFQRDKSMSLHHKKELLRQQQTTHDVAALFRDQIVGEPVHRLNGLTGCNQRIRLFWQKFKLQARSFFYQLEPWAGALKAVEGQFGTSIMSYFRFVRWLMFLNLYISIIMVGLTLVPHLVLTNHPGKFEDPFLNNSEEVKENITEYQKMAISCTKGYKECLDTSQAKENLANEVLDFLQGTGWMEKTVLFYGVYFNKTYTVKDSQVVYDMGLSYLLATGASFVISFILIVKNSAKGMKSGSLTQGGTMTQYCNKILAGWDFCIYQEKAADTKHFNIHAELLKDLADQRLQWKKASRTTKDMIRLYIIRFCINLIVCAILGSSLYLIYYSFQQLLTLQKLFGGVHPIVQVIIQYIPSLSITLLNVLIPIIFKKVVLLEDYTPDFEMRMTLLRTILLRLASLGVLMVSLYQLLTNGDETLESKCGNKRWAPLNSTMNSCGGNSEGNETSSVVKCWETYVGQQIYKLVLLDFLVAVIVTFVVEFPRRLMYKNLKDKVKLVEMVGQQEVDLPKVVLDIVYGQTLCWLGLFFSPLIPCMCFLKCFILFNIKKLSMLHNYVPPVRPYRTSRSNSLFIGMLFISFIMATIPVTYMIGNFNPSMSCGPFRLYSTNEYVFFDTVAQTISKWPSEAKDLFMFLGTTTFFVPAILVMLLVMYYFWAMKEGYLKMEGILQEQLKVEGRDKQFLLARVNEVWQHLEEAET